MNAIKNEKGERISGSWFAPPSAMIRCPYPDCTHSTNNVITKAHCRLEHGMEREEVGKKYGMPKVFEGRGVITSDNNGRKWNSTSGVVSDFSL